MIAFDLSIVFASRNLVIFLMHHIFDFIFLVATSRAGSRPKAGRYSYLTGQGGPQDRTGAGRRRLRKGGPPHRGEKEGAAMTRRFELCSGPVSWGAPDDRLHLLLGLPTRQEEPTPEGRRAPPTIN